MYVTTFYSFKGGVGRTMALVNVAVELAQRGKRVVAVDFDLEAPGLDTFDLGRPAETSPGIVDFVETYLATDRAPEAEDFLFKSPSLGNEGGCLWVMPSGSHDERYANRLAALDWHDLYDRFDGYLLFEDLKAQWRSSFKADYVLIDSRTGHTDVGGICTRQLPDAVVLLFFPNQQNLRGLKKIVHDIRGEPTRTEEDAIDLHYVLSNVPDLDDEDEILQGITADFQRELGFDHEPLTIHRYPSLSLLKQDIFTKDRPRSRLAREYRTLAADVSRLNPADRDGALEFIRRYGHPLSRRSARAHDRRERHLKQIEEEHQHDGEVLFRLARLHERRREEVFARLLDKAIDAGYRTLDAYLTRARHRRWQLDDAVGASEDALAALQVIPERAEDTEVLGLGSMGASFFDVSRALRFVAPEDLEKAVSLPAIRGMAADEQAFLAGRMLRNKDEAAFAASLLQPRLDSADFTENDLDPSRVNAALAFMATGRFEEAAAVCRASTPLEEMNVEDAFNYGMATWARDGEVCREPFARVIELAAADSVPVESVHAQGANYLQCLAVAHWALGDVPAAQDALAAAEARIRTERSSFSCWRYLHVPARIFVEDLREMRRMIEGDKTMVPRFMRRLKSEPA